VELLAAALTLFLVMDPLGNIPVFLSVLGQVPPARRRIVLARELVFSLLVLLGFLFCGRQLLAVLGLEEPTVGIAGGIVLFLIALRMVFPQEGGVLGDSPEGEPFVVPLAIPLIAGPSTLATLLLLVQSQPGRPSLWLGALAVAWTATAAILLSSTLLYRMLKQRGLVAMERLMGMLLVMLAVQMFLDGLKSYLAG
jgi:multiple antibiotic resistance protein